METFGDVLIVAESAATGQGPMARLYTAQWETPKPERDHAWRARIARTLTRWAAALTPAERRPERRERSLADGAAS